jgi:hypothetical protein
VPVSEEEVSMANTGYAANLRRDFAYPIVFNNEGE